MADKSERARLVREVVEKLSEQLERELPDETATLDQIEEKAGRIGRELSRELQRRLVEERVAGARENRVECRCGHRAYYKDVQPRSVVTSHGVLSFRRACYYCCHCKESFAPADAVLRVAGGTTEQVRVWAATVSGQMAFAQAATTLELLTRVSLSAATLERIAVAVGSGMYQEEARRAALHLRGQLPEGERPKERPRRLYVGMDGLFVPLRDAWKQDGSEGELHCRWGECKVGVVYEPEQDQEGKDVRVRRQTYTATLQSVEEFGPRLGALAHQNGHHWAKETVVMGDGAAWIWQIAAKQFTGAVQIVDFFHACQHLAEVADARFGKESPASRDWQKARQEDLKNNRLDHVLREIASWRPSNQDKRQLRRRAYNYFSENAHRMRYQTFLEQGYHIGSGVVEAGCKHVIGQRLDQAGMHWRQATAESIAALRAALCSSQPPDLRPYCRMVA